MDAPFRERILLAWGRMHIGEVIRRRALLQAIAPYLRPGRRILDAGCGRGDNALAIAWRYPDVSVDAIDVDERLVAGVQRRIVEARRSNGRALRGDVQTFTHPDGHRYGIVYSVDVFEHLRDPDAALRSIATQLEPDGVCIIHVPRATQRRWFRRFASYAQHDHEREGFEPDEIAHLAESAGISVMETRHTFGPPGALAWELFHLAQGVGKWLAVLTYPLPWSLSCVDGWFTWKRGNGLLVVARRNNRPA